MLLTRFHQFGEREMIEMKWHYRRCSDMCIIDCEGRRRISRKKKRTSKHLIFFLSKKKKKFAFASRIEFMRMSNWTNRIHGFMASQFSAAMHTLHSRTSYTAICVSRDAHAKTHSNIQKKIVLSRQREIGRIGKIAEDEGRGRKLKVNIFAGKYWCSPLTRSVCTYCFGMRVPFQMQASY